MARPTKLTRELVDKARKYIDVEVTLGGLYHGEIPMIARLAIYLDCHRDSIYEWAKQDTPLGHEFSDIVERIQEEQEVKLANKGLTGDYNPTIARLLLNSKHGYVETSKTDVTTDGKPLSDPYQGLTTAELKKLAKQRK